MKIHSSSPLSPPPGPQPLAPALKKAAQAFEAYFISSLLKEFRKSVPQGGLGGQGVGQEIYQSLFDEALAQKMSETGGVGLTRFLLRNMSLKFSRESTDMKGTRGTIDLKTP